MSGSFADGLIVRRTQHIPDFHGPKIPKTMWLSNIQSSSFNTLLKQGQENRDGETPATSRNAEHAMCQTNRVELLFRTECSQQRGGTKRQIVFELVYGFGLWGSEVVSSVFWGREIGFEGTLNSGDVFKEVGVGRGGGLPGARQFEWMSNLVMANFFFFTF